MRKVIFCSLACLCAVAMAQTQPRGTLAGDVIDGANGQPVPRASITIVLPIPPFSFARMSTANIASNCRRGAIALSCRLRNFSTRPSTLWK
jgi:hypothetical protein